MKSIGVTGPPGSGKSTMWRAITSATSKGEVAVIEVPEPRLDKLVELHSSRSRVAAQLQLADVHASERSQPAAIAKLREMDALLLVVAAFGGQDAEKALSLMRDELVLADMGPLETRLARARKDPAAKPEVPSLEAAMELLNEGRFLSEAKWEAPDLKVFSALAPITLKPIIVVLNVDEASIAEPPSIEAAGMPFFVADASLEAEVAGLSSTEAAPLLEAYGVTESSMGRVIQSVYRSLDLITFFTTSDKESRAWEVRRGATAPEAAGVIHSDMQRGFIRAEVVSYEELIAAGSWDACKGKGLLRVEGKDYVFKEGDVTHFRFAV